MGIPHHPTAQHARRVLQWCVTYCAYWPSEAGVVSLGCDLLKALVRPIDVSAYPQKQANVPQNTTNGTQRLDALVPVVVKIPEFDELLKAHGNDQAGQFPERLAPELRQRLIEALTIGALPATHSTSRPPPIVPWDSQTRFSILMGPLENRLERLTVCSTSTTAPYVDLEVASILRQYAGICRAACVNTFAVIAERLERALPFLSMAMRQLLRNPFDASLAAPFLHLAHDYAETLLPYLTVNQCGPFFAFSRDLMALHHATAHSLADGQVGRSDDILTALQLLTHLISKDLIDWEDPVPQKVDPKEGGAPVLGEDIVGTVFFGLGTVLPLMTPQLLQVPDLCLAFFALAGYLASDYAEHFASLDFALFGTLANALQFGFEHENAQVSRESLHGIKGLVDWHNREVEVGRPGLGEQLRQHHALATTNQQTAGSPDDYKPLLSKWLQKLLELLVFQASIWDRVDACADVILALLIAEAPRY